jgi:hypothetical protein
MIQSRLSLHPKHLNQSELSPSEHWTLLSNPSRHFAMTKFSFSFSPLLAFIIQICCFSIVNITEKHRLLTRAVTKKIQGLWQILEPKSNATKS